MTNHVAEFEAELVRHSRPLGGVFRKLDLHVHSPTDPGYEYRAPDAFEKLGSALATGGYSIAAIVEHGRVTPRETLERLQRLSPGVTLLPGAEINLFVDAVDKKIAKDQFYHCLVIIDPNQRQDYSFILEKAHQELASRTSQTGVVGYTSSVDDVARFFRDEGALFIPAHLHQSRQPSKSRSIDDIYDDPAFLQWVSEGIFSALEVLDERTAGFFRGNQRTSAGLTIPHATCVRSSDAHSHEHLASRSRYTWVKCEYCTFLEVQEALAFRGRTQLEEPPVPTGRIVGLRICGQFIRDEWILLNPSMNCLIGCKGSGKTAILECLRFVLGTALPEKRAKEIASHVSHVLGSSGFVSCLVESASGSKLLLTRRADSQGRLVVHRDGAPPEEVEDAQQAGFRASVLGWHEIEGIADDARARISLLDRVGIEEEVHRLHGAIDEEVEAARDQLPVFQRKLKHLNESLTRRDALREKRKTLEKLEEAKLAALQKDYEAHLACEQRLTALSKAAAKAGQDVETGLDTLFGAFTDDLAAPQSYPAEIQPLVAEAKAEHEALRVLRDRSRDGLAEGFSGVAARIGALLAEAKAAFSGFRANVYDPKVNALPAAERDVLTRQIQIIEETKSLPEIERECESIAVEIRQLASTIRASCEEICTDRARIVALREDVVQRINSRNAGTHAKLKKSADRTGRERYARSYGATATELFRYLERYGSADSYVSLRDLFDGYSRFDTEAPGWAIDSLLWKAEVVEFLSVLDDDDVELSMVLPNGNLAPIQNVSAGQRCTAIFPILVMISEGPLVIDQPEDNLDNRHIADVVAPEFVARKVNQQFVLTSHNANLVVLTDSELIMHVESNGSIGTITNSGFLACSESPIRDAVLGVLDGGEAALVARKRKYGIH
ncbi:MAG: AAA family ATPase [Thermotogota bacterium]